MPPMPSSAAACIAAALGLAVLAAAGAEAAAADARTKTFAVEGIGQTPCSAYVEARDERGEHYYNFGGWIDGYLTAYNHHNADTYDITPFENIDLLAAVLARFCQRHPEVPFFQAIASMVEELKPHRLRERGEPVTLEAGGETVTVYRVVVARVQEALAAAGHYDGAVDGAYGPKTRAAIAAFQAERGLPQTGLPDQVTLLRLLRGR